MFRFKPHRLLKNIIDYKGFNTSYVSVQENKKEGAKDERKNVSIHPMFRFKIETRAEEYKELYEFQYILCFGSS